MIAEHAVEIVKRMLDDAGGNGERWTTLVEALGDVPREAHEAILAGLSSLAREPLPHATRAGIWNALRQCVSKHRSFADADWALPPEPVNDIAGVFAQFEPDDPITRDGYLFSYHPALPEGREQDRDAHDRLLAARRIEAARAWYRAAGAEAIIRVSATLERADAVGDSLAESGAVPRDEEPALLQFALEYPEFPARAFGRAYLARRFSSGGVTIPEFLREHGGTWPATTQAEALLAMPTGADTWNEAEVLGDGGRTHYWQNARVHWVDDADLTRAIRELVRHGRPHAAIDLAAMHVRRDPKLSADDVRHALLEAAPLECDVTGYRSQSYDVSELVSYLERESEAGRIAEDEVARLELLYLPLLRHGRRPQLLHKALRQDPALFIDAVCLAFRGEGEPERDLDDAARGRAQLAYELLSDWRTPPGLKKGVIDGGRLDAWIAEARRRLAENNRAAIGDQLIGQVLSGSPPGEDGAWPAEPIREVIERLRSEDLEAGLHIGRFNQRGVFTKSPLSGGDLERGLKARYEADAVMVAARWPRTAAFLRAFAATYERDAAREDLDAELRHDLDS